MANPASILRAIGLDTRPEWPQAIRRYLAGSFVVHLVWEIVQLPLYTIWTTGTVAQQAFAVLHCTIGDTMIAGLSLLIVLSVADRPTWPRGGSRGIWLALLMLGVGYTLYSEWMNVNVRRSWAYSAWMPTLPTLGVGLAPVLQWFVVPTLVLWLAIGRPPWTETGKETP